MATPELSIDYEAVGQLAHTFGQSALQFQLVTSIVRSLSYTMRALSFTNPELVRIADHFVVLAVSCERMSAKCEEYAVDLNAAINALKNGDNSGRARFAR
jgi:hypothetical protein